MQERFFRRLLSNIKCGFCGERYEASNISIIGHQENLWFLSALCFSCHGQALVAVVIQEGAVGEVITDLTEKEYAKLRDGKVSIDDVLDMHNLLKDLRGDISNLIGKGDLPRSSPR